MSSQTLISSSVPTLLPDETGDRALALMEENNISQIPVVAEDKYLALVKEDEVLDWETPEQPLSKSNFLRYSPAINVASHPYDVIKLSNSQSLSVIPVIDGENNYLGAITHETIIKYIAEDTGLEATGGILVLEIAPKDYSLYEVARICESEEVVIIRSHMRSNIDTGKLELTIKTNRNDVDAVASAMERHGYVVKEVFGAHSNKDDMMERYNLLMAYINM